MPSLLEQIAAAKRRGIRSAPQNAVLSHAAQGFQTQGFQNHIPARGRKHLYVVAIKFYKGLFQNHIPARGRKPHSRNPCKQQMLFQNHIPARGRKPSCRRSTRRPREPFQNHIPARGRKPLGRKPPFFHSNYFKTTSPQGDGNKIIPHVPSLIMRISKPHPRKGTETA